MHKQREPGDQVRFEAMGHTISDFTPGSGTILCFAQQVYTDSMCKGVFCENIFQIVFKVSG